MSNRNERPEAVEMHLNFKHALAAACLLEAVAAGPSLAQSWIFTYPGYYDQPYYLNRHYYCPAYSGYYNAYQGPYGTYGSLADFSRSIPGTPCGIECTRTAQARWAQYYCDPPRYRDVRR